MFRFLRFQRIALPMILASTLASVPAARAQSTESFSLSPVVSFTGNSGAAPGSNPEFNLIQASDGNF